MGNRGKEKGEKNAHRPPVETVRELQKDKSSHLLHKQLKTTLQLTYDLRTGSLSNGMYSRG